MRLLKGLLVGIGAIGLILGCILIAAFIYPKVRGVDHVNAGQAFSQPLMIPALLEPRLENGEKVFDLTARRGAVAFQPGAATATAGYNGAYLGPTIRVHRGDRVRMNVLNGLGEPTTVHWHGMHLPAAMDGGPHQVIDAGATWRPHWTIGNEAATLWYHPHVAGKTGPQVYSGLAGMIIIDDARSNALALPRTYGVDDIPVIVQDRKFDRRGQFIYEHDPQKNRFGMLGDEILVNGTLGPYAIVPRKLVRLRLLNGSNARRYNFGFSDDRSFQQITTDGGLLEAPVKRTRLVLAPGERAEIVVDMSRTTRPVSLVSHAVPGVQPMMHMLRRLTAGPNDEYQRFTILELRTSPTAYPPEILPQKLNEITWLDPGQAAKVRVFRLTNQSSINGKSMDHARVDAVVRLGDSEIWEIRNEEALFYHPFHVHDVQFQILSRDGEEPKPYERGWKDTVIVNPRETVRLITRFTDYADPTLPYMFHCHILEHEDMGMMGQFVVVDDPSRPVGIVSPLGSKGNMTHGGSLSAPADAESAGTTPNVGVD